jgi:DNA (cytosine-5)-methyltransferase 1
LCSGIGGFALGFEWAGLSKPVLFCDTEPWCRTILEKHWPDVPIAKDVKEIANEPDRFIPRTDRRQTILTAGYPCQPFSVAGLQRGSEDDRHLWPYISEIVAQQKPAWCVFENVYGHIALGIDEVLLDLEGQGYASQPLVLPACAVGAPHIRNRVFIVSKYVGDPEHNGSSAPTLARSTGKTENNIEEGSKEARQSARTSGRADDVYVGNASDDRRDRRGEEAERAGQTGQPDKPRAGLRRKSSRPGQHVADPDSKRGRGGNAEREDAETARQSPSYSWHYERGVGIWDTEPRILRVANGIPKRVDRIKGLGNAIVPQLAQRIGEAIKAVHDG